MENKKYIDFHMHSTYSDGDLTPSQLMSLAAYRGLDIVALSDHDTVRGYPEAKKQGNRYGLVVIPGVEITTPKYHLLSLGFNPDDKQFIEFLKHSEALQRQACSIRITKLQEIGIPITMEKIDRDFPNARLGKKNIFTALMTDRECWGYFRDTYPDVNPRDIFLKYFGHNGVASDIKDRPAVSVDEAIYQVHKAGGIIGIAHPVKDVEDMKELEILVEKGIDFMEIQPRFKDKKFEQWAREHNLPTTYGSDYHGPTMTREMLTREDNVLSPELEDIIPAGLLERNKVFI